MDRAMLHRGRVLSLWGLWWNAMQLLRPAFSRSITFMWFATIVAGMAVRADTLGVTSIVRALNLTPVLYHRLLANFHSSGVKLDRRFTGQVIDGEREPGRRCFAEIERGGVGRGGAAECSADGRDGSVGVAGGMVLGKKPRTAPRHAGDPTRS